jgi:pimeloyl-ACP methyl ester carboxylesterase
MPTLTTDDGVKLYYEEAGSGVPLVFVHEFAGDLRSWELQMQHFARLYRCIAYNARGYPPSDVPKSIEQYSQDRATDDIRAVLDALKIDKAHIVGLSMGAFATLHFGIRYPGRALSLTIAGGGYGAHPAQYEKFQTDAKSNAQLIRDKGMAYFAANYGHPTRIQLKNKDPRGYDQYVKLLGEHSVEGSANTMLGYQARRPSLYALAEEMKKIPVPALILAGDEEEPCLEACLLMKRCIPKAGLALLPKSGHTINLEEPALFNRLVEDFLHKVQAGRWSERDPLAAPPSIWGPGGRP